MNVINRQKHRRSRQFRLPALLGLLVCATGLFAIPRKASSQVPEGVFSIANNGKQPQGEVLANPDVDGITIRQNWSDLEPAEGAFNWAYLDSAVAASAAAGKPVLLRVGTQAGKPAWVTTAVANAGGTFFTFDDNGVQATIPVFWDPTFLAKKTAMIADLGAHFTDNPAVKIVSVSFANAKSEDWAVPHTSTDVTNWLAAGYTSQKMLDAGKQIIDATMAAFPNQYVTLAVGSNGHVGGTGNLDPTATYVASNAVLNARASWPGRLIVQINSLSTFNPAAPGPDDSDWRLLWDSQPDVAGQMLDWCFGDTTYRVNAGVPIDPAVALTESVDVGVSYGMKYIEIYQKDVVNLPAVITYAHNALPGTPTPTPTPTPAPTDLQVTVTDGKDAAVAGQKDSYTIVVTNVGSSDVTDAVVSDSFPDTFTGVTFTATQSGGATGFSGAGTGNISDTVTLPSGSQITYKAKGTISSSATGTISDEATVTSPSGVTDSNPADNSATDTDTITFQADLKITVTDGQITAVAGKKNTYTIVVTNNGASDVTDAVVTDDFPAILTGLTFTATQSGGASGFTASGTGNINDTVTMPAGSFITYKATGKIRSSATGTLSNAATVSAPIGVTDPNLVNNSATDTDTITFQTDLKVTVTDGQSTAVAGQNETYTIVVTNLGPSNVTGAVVTDLFPAILTGLTFTATQSGGASGFTAAGTDNINDTVTMRTGSVITYKASGTISPSATGTLSDTVMVTDPIGVTDPNLNNNSATDTDSL